MKFASLTLLAAITFVTDCASGMHVWVDSNGVKHISTHPKECFKGKDLPYNRCAPISGNGVSNSSPPKHHEKRADQLFSRDECEKLKLRRDRLARNIQKAQESMNQMTRRGSQDVDALDFDVNKLIELPAKLRHLQKEMLLTDKKYDYCFPVEQRVSRSRIRKSIADQTNQNAAAFRHGHAIRDIRIQLRQIQQALEKR